METIRIPGKGCYCSIKVEPKDEWEKYESHRVYMKNRVKFTFDETMVILVQGSFVLHNYSKHRIKIYVKHDKEESPEIYSIKQEGEDCWDYGNATSALHMNLVKEVDSGKKERFVIPGEGIFCILYVYTLSGEWKPFYDVPRQINNNGILKVSDKMVKEVLANINKKRVIPDGNYLFVGNPGVGKNTLAKDFCKFITNTVVGFERDKKEVKLDLKNYEELQQLMGEKIQEFQKIIDNMTSTQAKDIERLQKENEMRV